TEMNGKPTESEHFAGILPYPVRFCKYCINEIENSVIQFKKKTVFEVDFPSSEGKKKVEIGGACDIVRIVMRENPYFLLFT
ncbi:MAG: hypothetical protein SOY66_11345, partial [Evtepia sp.]|nr:hypothetical protein [Evtepia sp.]